MNQSAVVGNKREYPQDLINDMDNKKFKSDTPMSKVVHIRQLPPDAQEADIRALASPFGTITNTLLMRSKSQAFVELQDIDSAKTMLNYYQYIQATIHGKVVYLQYSQHQELRTNNQNNNNQNNQQQNDQRSNGDSNRTNGCVLKVVVSNIVYPVTIDVLQQVFQRCGDIQKIVTFVRNEQYHALIQYSNNKESSAAKTLFDKQNIYNGCNTLHVEFSKMAELTVKYNNDKMRDFTKPDKPSYDNSMNAQLQAMQAMAPGMLPVPQSAFHSQLFPQTFNLPGFPNMGGNLSPNSNFNLSMMAGGAMNMGRQGSVLLVSNLNEEDISCDDLFILFGHYGDVIRVKILFNKKDTALIQFADSQQASTALQNLNNVTLYGREMRVSRSKHDNVNMPKSEDEGQELTKDYSNSPLHRFKKPGSKNFQNIFPPIQSLHLSNIPESVDEDELQGMFAKCGTINNFRFFPKDRKMALIQMSSVEEALISLIKLHNFKLNESSHLRVSFAKQEMSS